MLRRRSKRTPVTSQTIDLIYQLIWAGPNLEALRDRLKEVVNDNKLWVELGKFETCNKILDSKLTRLINKAKRGK